MRLHGLEQGRMMNRIIERRVWSGVLIGAAVMWGSAMPGFGEEPPAGVTPQKLTAREAEARHAEAARAVGIKGEMEEVELAYLRAKEIVKNELQLAKEAGPVKRFTNQDLRKLLGKEPEFAGNPGQINYASRYYEAYVWRSRLKPKFVAPPVQPEMLDLYAMYSGEVPPEKVKYRTKGFDKHASRMPEKFDAPVLWVYYGPEDPGTKTREVLEISTKRLLYLDDVRTPPDAAELKKRHEQNMSRMINDLEKFQRRKLTQAERDALDSWKNPRPAATEGQGGPEKKGGPQEKLKRLGDK